MSMPSVLNITYQGKTYNFNGWVGNYTLTQIVVFEFVDEEDVTRIWVDVNGVFVCGE